MTPRRVAISFKSRARSVVTTSRDRIRLFKIFFFFSCFFFFFLGSLDLHETSKLTAKTHGRIRSALQLGGQRA